ncbi:MAG TPA: hypothetical protein P5079_07310, partial [Elusimicrobiota bacterium]|nr:hypothetical protein [Elusimicrobiota bacterium]
MTAGKAAGTVVEVGKAISVGTRLMNAVKIGLFMGAFNAGNLLLQSISSGHAPSVTQLAAAFGVGFLMGMVFGSVSSRVSSAWVSNIRSQFVNYLRNPLTFMASAVNTAGSLAIFNATPFGAAFNYVMAIAAGKDFGWAQYFGSISQGMQFGLTMGPFFAMAMPAQAISRGELMTAFTEIGPTRTLLRSLFGGSVTDALAWTPLAARGGLMGQIGQWLHMTEMVGVYHIASVVGGAIGGLFDRLLGTTNFMDSPEGPVGLFASTLANLSFFLVPTAMATRTEVTTKDTVSYLEGGLKKLETSRTVLEAEGEGNLLVVENGSARIVKPGEADYAACRSELAKAERPTTGTEAAEAGRTEAAREMRPAEEMKTPETGKVEGAAGERASLPEMSRPETSLEITASRPEAAKLREAELPAGVREVAAKAKAEAAPRARVVVEITEGLKFLAGRTVREAMTPAKVNEVLAKRAGEVVEIGGTLFTVDRGLTTLAKFAKMTAGPNGEEVMRGILTGEIKEGRMMNEVTVTRGLADMARAEMTVSQSPLRAFLSSSLESGAVKRTEEGYELKVSRESLPKELRDILPEKGLGEIRLEIDARTGELKLMADIQGVETVGQFLENFYKQPGNDESGHGAESAKKAIEELKTQLVDGVTFKAELALDAQGRIREGTLTARGEFNKIVKENAPIREGKGGQLAAKYNLTLEVKIQFKAGGEVKLTYRVIADQEKMNDANFCKDLKEALGKETAERLDALVGGEGNLGKIRELSFEVDAKGNVVKDSLRVVMDHADVQLVEGALVAGTLGFLRLARSEGGNVIDIEGPVTLRQGSEGKFELESIKFAVKEGKSLNDLIKGLLGKRQKPGVDLEMGILLEELLRQTGLDLNSAKFELFRGRDGEKKLYVEVNGKILEAYSVVGRAAGVRLADIRETQQSLDLVRLELREANVLDRGRLESKSRYLEARLDALYGRKSLESWSLHRMEQRWMSREADREISARRTQLEDKSLAPEKKAAVAREMQVWEARRSELSKWRVLLGSRSAKTAYEIGTFKATRAQVRAECDKKIGELRTTIREARGKGDFVSVRRAEADLKAERERRSGLRRLSWKEADAMRVAMEQTTLLSRLPLDKLEAARRQELQEGMTKTDVERYEQELAAAEKAGDRRRVELLRDKIEMSRAMQELMELALEPSRAAENPAEYFGAIRQAIDIISGVITRRMEARGLKADIFADLKSQDRQVHNRAMEKLLKEVFGIEGGDTTKLNFAQRFAIEFKVMESVYGKNPLFLGKFPLQAVLFVNCLVGRIGSLKTAGGKSAVFTMVFGDMALRGKLRGKVGELIVDKYAEIEKYTDKDYPPLAAAFGVKYVDGAKYYHTRNYKELSEIYRSAEFEGESGVVMVYDSHSRGFLELTARADNPFDLNSTLNNVSARGVDEADVPALSRLAFIESRSNVRATEAEVQNVEGLLRNFETHLGLTDALLKRLDGQGAKALEGLKVEGAEGTRYVDREAFEALRYSEEKVFTVYDGKIQASKGLIEALRGPAEAKTRYSTQQVENALRALYDIATHQDAKVDILTGEIVRYDEKGVMQKGVIDGSLTYNISMTLLKIRSLDAQGVQHGVDRLNVRISDAHAEATLSQIFSRSADGQLLTFGGSATLDVAGEIARVIFDALPIEIEGSDFVKDYLTNPSKLAPEIKDVSDPSAQVSEALSLIRKAVAEKQGALIGVGDVMKQKMLLAEILIKIGGESSEAVAKLLSDTVGKSMSEVLLEARARGMKIAERIDVIDGSLTPYKSPEQIAESSGRIVKDGKVIQEGRIVISNLSGLRAISYKGEVHMAIIDAHRMTYGELLQALGRVERSDFTAKSERLIMIDSREMGFVLREMIKADTYFRQKGVADGLFEGRKATREKFEAFIKGVTPESLAKGLDRLGKPLTREQLRDLVQVATEFRTLLEKSESIQFKSSVETLTKILKEPLARMRALDRDFVSGLEREILSKSEDFSSEMSAGEFRDPIRMGKDGFLQAANFAISMWARVAAESGSKVARAEAKLRISEIQRAIDQVDATFANAERVERTFASTPESVYGRPAQHVAGVLASLSRFIMPVEGRGFAQTQALAKAPKTVLEAQAALKEMGIQEGTPEFARVTDSLQARPADQKGVPPLSYGDGTLTFAGKALMLSIQQFGGLSEEDRTAVTGLVTGVLGVAVTLPSEATAWAAEAAMSLYGAGVLPLENFTGNTVNEMVGYGAMAGLLAKMGAPVGADQLKINLRSSNPYGEFAKAIAFAGKTAGKEYRGVVKYFRDMVLYGERLTAAQRLAPGKGFKWVVQLPAKIGLGWNELRMTSRVSGSQLFKVALGLQARGLADMPAVRALAEMSFSLWTGRATRQEKSSPKITTAELVRNLRAVTGMLADLKTPAAVLALRGRITLKDMWEAPVRQKGFAKIKGMLDQVKGALGKAKPAEVPDYTDSARRISYLSAKLSQTPFTMLQKSALGMATYWGAHFALGLVTGGASTLLTLGTVALSFALNWGINRIALWWTVSRRLGESQIQSQAALLEKAAGRMQPIIERTSKDKSFQSVVDHFYADFSAVKVKYDTLTGSTVAPELA